ncbi:MAG: RNA-directed DNA polymerase [Dehalococcoidia bacterium]|nr:RNA-directed DNA polymerase [Dehalococcoidia bacterium]
MRQAHASGYKYALLTDLTAYFDHVNHKILLGQLRSFRVSEKNLALLGDLLEHWSGGSPVGIPQGLDPSSFLGNIYLDRLDKHMVRKKYHYFRYVDDIRVFANSESELQRAMVDIIRQNRALGLHVQTGKTKIVTGEEILQLVNERNDEFSAIDYHLDFGDVDTAEGELKEILREVMAQEEFNDRHFRKCLNGLKKANSPAAVPSTLQKLDELQPWAQTTHEYLDLFTRSHFSIKRRLMEFLMDRDRNIFAWPEFWAVRTLVSAAKLPREFLDWCRSRIGDPECHWNCRGQYALVLGAHGDLSDQMLVQDLISSRENEYERRAFVASLRDLPEPGKGRVLEQLGRDYPAVVSTLALVR